MTPISRGRYLNGEVGKKTKSKIAINKGNQTYVKRNNNIVSTTTLKKTVSKIKK